MKINSSNLSKINKTFITLLVLVTSSTILFNLAGCQKNNLPKQKKSDFFVTTTAGPVGWDVVEVKGVYCQFFQYTGNGDYVDKFQDALNLISAQGKKEGANGFVNFRIASESHEIQGSKWHASIVNMCGDFAVIQ